MKIGPLSSDLVVGCGIYDFKVHGTPGVEVRQLEERLFPLVSKSTIGRALETLESWGVLKIEFARVESGRPGRLFTISGESEGMIKETYDEYWERIDKIIKDKRSEDK